MSRYVRVSYLLRHVRLLLTCKTWSSTTPTPNKQSHPKSDVRINGFLLWKAAFPPASEGFVSMPDKQLPTSPWWALYDIGVGLPCLSPAPPKKNDGFFVPSNCSWAFANKQANNHGKPNILAQSPKAKCFQTGSSQQSLLYCSHLSSIHVVFTLGGTNASSSILSAAPRVFSACNSACKVCGFGW